MIRHTFEIRKKKLSSRPKPRRNSSAAPFCHAAGPLHAPLAELQRFRGGVLDVDVFVNGVRTFSQDVDSGPFRMTNLPSLSEQGDAIVIILDSSGRDVGTTLPFLVSNKLLHGGLFDFSAESGFPRLLYGAQSNV
jgi:hypothetical protein